MNRILILLVAIFLPGCQGNNSTPVREEPVAILFDTDMGPDYDDVGALAILHTMADNGEANILVTGSSNLMEQSTQLIDVINTWYGRPDIPVGAPKTWAPSLKAWHTGKKWTEELPARYPHTVPVASEAPDILPIYREILATQPDHSVTIVVVGFLTNMKNLLNSSPDGYSDLPGEELVRRKVKRMVCMAGAFPSGREFNVYTDTESAQAVFRHWPGEIIISGYEIGNPIRTGERLIQMEGENNPVKDAYAMSIEQDRLETGNARYTPGGRSSYDQTAVLVAVRGTENYFETQRGVMSVQDNGSNTWQPSTEGKHIILVQKHEPQKLAWIIEDLMMEPPLVRKTEKQ